MLLYSPRKNLENSKLLRHAVISQTAILYQGEGRSREVQESRTYIFMDGRFYSIEEFLNLFVQI